MLTLGQGVVDWVGEQLKSVYSNAQGIGWQKDGKLVAGLVFEGYNQANIYVHIAKLHGERLPPSLIAAMFDYPFNQLGVKRISAVVNDTNEQSMAFARKLGAHIDGFLEDGAPSGNLVIFGLLRKDAAKWLNPKFQRRLGAFDGRSNIRDRCLS